MEYKRIEHALSSLRKKRHKKPFLLYPGCSDEISFHQNFLDSVFESTPISLISKDTKVFTIDSCFAVNVKHYLSDLGFSAETFRRSEEINSVFSNLLLLEASRLPETDQIAYISDCYSQFVGQFDLTEGIEYEQQQLRNLYVSMADSNIIVLTLGNTIEGYLNNSFRSVSKYLTIPNVFPRFLQVFQSQNVKHQVKALRILKSRGGDFRLGTSAEVGKALAALIDVIFEINPSAHLVITVSPVPVINAMGLDNRGGLGPIEIDCQTKTTLRSSLGEVLLERGDDRVHYFPSFEIVRWIGSNLPGSAFGDEDAASGHVSQALLDAIYGFFVRKYAVDGSAS